MKTLTVGEFQHSVLLAIRENPTDSSVTSLTKRLTKKNKRDVHTGEVSRALKRLEMRRIIEKVPVEDDRPKGLAGRPRQTWALTELGHMIAREAAYGSAPPADVAPGGILV